MATSQSGEARAELLDNALEYISPQLGNIEERGDDPILYFYGDTVLDQAKPYLAES
jgi:hypothetical protein